jgi:hypothetical protein
MKKYILSLFCLIILVPSLAFASLWQPSSWFYNWTFQKPHDINKILKDLSNKQKEDTLNNSSTTIITASSTKTSPAHSTLVIPKEKINISEKDTKMASKNTFTTVKNTNSVKEIDPNKDTDHDGMTDSYELINGYNPNKDEKKEALTINLSSCNSQKDAQTTMTTLGQSFSLDTPGQSYAWRKCISNLSMAKDNVFVCDTFSDAGRDGCYEYFAIKRNSTAMCGTLGTDNIKKDCYYVLAFINRNTALCEKSGSVLCYEKMAMYYKKPEACDQMSLFMQDKNFTNTQAACYAFFGNANSDISYCDKAEAENPEIGNFCYYNLALSTSNLNTCSKINQSAIGGASIAKACLTNAKVADACHLTSSGKGVHFELVGNDEVAIWFSKNQPGMSPHYYCIDEWGDYGGGGAYINSQRAQGVSDAQIRSSTFINGEPKEDINAYFKFADRLLNK